MDEKNNEVTPIILDRSFRRFGRLRVQFQEEKCDK